MGRLSSGPLAPLSTRARSDSSIEEGGLCELARGRGLICRLGQAAGSVC